MQEDIMGKRAMGIDEIYSEDPISVLHFAFRSHFQKFVTDIHKIMLKYHNTHPYNSITSLVRFYEKFKKQDLPLLEFYETAHQPSIQKDSQNCIGRALYLRGKLLKHLKAEYPDLETYIYCVSSNIYNTSDIPKRYRNIPPEGTEWLKDHSCLALKFTLESEKRRGHMILDPGYSIDFPIVVMEDGQPPNTGKFEFLFTEGVRSYEFKYFNEYYVYWISDSTKSTSSSENKARVVHHWFYVGKKLQNVLQIERRNQLYAFHALAYAGLAGPEAAIYTVLGAKDHFVMIRRNEEIQYKDGEEPSVFTIHKVPFSYALSDEDPRNEEWEDILKTLEEKFHYANSFMDLLKSFSKIAVDQDFVDELSRINTEWSSKIEGSFDT